MADEQQNDSGSVAVHENEATQDQAQPSGEAQPQPDQQPPAGETNQAQGETNAAQSETPAPIGETPAPTPRQPSLQELKEVHQVVTQARAQSTVVVSSQVLYHPLHPTKTAEGTYDTVEEPAIFTNGVTETDTLPAIVLRVFPATGELQELVNLMVFTDGGGIVYKQGVKQGTGLGQWSWPA